MMDYGSKEHYEWLRDAAYKAMMRKIDHAGFDFESFVDGYIECALWADCMPPEPPHMVVDDDKGYYVIEHKGIIMSDERYWSLTVAEEMAEHYNADAGYNREHGGREHLELREGARERMIEKGQLVEFVSDNLSDLLAYVRGCYDGEREGYDHSQGYPESYAGHDLWLTRSGHGAGYWDRGLGELGDRLTEAAKSYGSPDDHTPYDCGDNTADV